MKVEKDLRDDASEQTERKNEKIGGNSVRSFAVLTLCAVLAMIISFGTKIFAGNGSNRVYAAADRGAGIPLMKKQQFQLASQEWFQAFRIHHHPEVRSPGSEVPVSR